ncbi:6-pyruvoyl trahydropterin synthase family protein [Arsenicicoccus sp. oral taxon 190]|uniref:6-pyruvoyl trahydropterin synthase family protein n=1 Tax=Arsenicicoccus sp. oral taxon 190 TaxID=1658671 RepID=UPI00067A2BA1|nr:6-carboxytetrahydropterin synthase [Arsenicicoccus sp. oral taxon 190]AKT50334.1 hypothetical protein ADJ73_01570 [Arsenicicoccus sp. oral taxon 190]
MFSVTVGSRFMCAHSLPDPFFGPAQQLHGVTYVVEATFERRELDEHNVVVDIGAATEQLRAILAPLDYRNLDDVEELSGLLTTTERMAQHIAERLTETMDLTGLHALQVLLREHADAWASYRIDLSA